ncbi:hypothetical protein ACIA5C_47760 [Actinoplanes sp. NPDC051343]|uniref:hypothetical protein n=1 Tax=Actinoplanes sp. NPDC051343 TaxID=3363906 RepID=UPI00379484A7
MFLLVHGTAVGLSLAAWDFTETVIVVLLTAIGGATGAVLRAGHHPGWIRASASGLELAATGCQPVFLPWSAVQSVKLRFTSPVTELLVTPTSLNAATVAALPARAPRVQRRSGAAAFIVDVGLMTPGPSAPVRRRRGPLATTSACGPDLRRECLIALTVKAGAFEIAVSLHAQVRTGVLISEVWERPRIWLSWALCPLARCLRRLPGRISPVAFRYCRPSPGCCRVVCSGG